MKISGFIKKKERKKERIQTDGTHPIISYTVDVF
jgi:hypothetical protein